MENFFLFLVRTIRLQPSFFFWDTHRTYPSFRRFPSFFFIIPKVPSLIDSQSAARPESRILYSKYPPGSHPIQSENHRRPGGPVTQYSVLLSVSGRVPGYFGLVTDQDQRGGDLIYLIDKYTVRRRR